MRATVDSHPGTTYPGRVVRVAPYVLDLETQNRTVAIEVELDDRSLAQRLLPGTSADVEVILDTHDRRAARPGGLGARGRQGADRRSDGRLVERSVETGLRNWDFIEIVSGLAEGDQVVTSLDRPEVQAPARARRSPFAAPAGRAASAAPAE